MKSRPQISSTPIFSQIKLIMDIPSKVHPTNMGYFNNAGHDGRTTPESVIISYGYGYRTTIGPSVCKEYLNHRRQRIASHPVKEAVFSSTAEILKTSWRAFLISITFGRYEKMLKRRV